MLWIVLPSHWSTGCSGKAGASAKGNRSMDQLYLSGNESDGFAEDKGKPLPFFLCFYLLSVMDEEIEVFCLSIPSVNLLVRNIP